MSKRFGKNDLILILAIIVLIGVTALCYSLFFKKSGGKTIITVDGQFFMEASLDRDQTIEITDSKGNVTNFLVIKNGCADMIEANCPDRLCVKQKAISYDMESIICLPNKVVVTISSDKVSDYDVIAQ